GKDHVLHDADPVLGEEHMLRSAEPYALGPEPVGDFRILGGVRVGPYPEGPYLVRPSEYRREYLVILRFLGLQLVLDHLYYVGRYHGDVARIHLAHKPVEGYVIPFLHLILARVETFLLF